MFSFLYKKEDGSRDLNNPTNQNVVEDIQIAHCNNNNPSAYEKTDGEISPKIILVLSGGTVRERKHLNALQDAVFHTCLKFIFLADDRAKPKWMCDYWKHLNGEIIVNNQKIKLTSIDESYFITDVDDFGKDIKQLIQQGEPQNATWIISNPCIEMWLYYCYFDNPTTDLADMISLSEDERSQWLKGKLPELKNGGIDPRRAFENIKTGIENARKNYSEDQSNHFPNLFSTQMYLFSEKIFNTIEKPFQELLYAKKKKIQQFIEKMKGNRKEEDCIK